MSESNGDSLATWIPASSPSSNELQEDKSFQLRRSQATKNFDLKTTEYKIEDEKGNFSIEIYLSDEAKQLGLGFRWLRKFALEEFARIQADPFGATSIDPTKNEAEARKLRTVNRLQDRIQALIPVPIAIKGSGTDIFSVDKEDLLAQYQNMRKLELTAREKLTPAQQSVLGFAKVYGAVRIGNQEFLIMDYIEDAHWIKDVSRIADDKLQPAFASKDEPDLVHLFPDLERKIGIFREKYIFWRDLTDKLSKILDIDLGDLAGRNVLKQRQADGKWRYIIIDQKAEN